MFVTVLASSQAMNPPLGTASAPAGLAGGFVLLTTVFLTAMLPFDFRGDVDRMAYLKTLPLPPWRLAVGQVVAPVLIVTLLQWLVLAVLYFSGLLHDADARGPWLARRGRSS